MKLAVSNIAWPADLEPAAADLLARLKVPGVEIAPTKAWPVPAAASAEDVARCRGFWNDRGIEIVAFQALLFGRPDLQIFRTDALREETHAMLAVMIRLAAACGARALVFGSPKNRLVGEGSPGAAWDTAVTFFRRVGRVAHDAGVWLCIEPNPVAYGCDFVTRAAEALDLVRAVDQPGFGLHLDTAGMTLSEDGAEVIGQAGEWWRHFHVSDPQLAPVGGSVGRHPEFAQALRSARYDGWISIEMKTIPAPDCLPSLERAVEFCRATYGDA